MRILRKIIGFKLNHNSRVNFMPSGFLDTNYLMAIEKKKVNMCEIVSLQLLDNIEKLKKSKKVVSRFESLLTYLFFEAIR